MIFCFQLCVFAANRSGQNMSTWKYLRFSNESDFVLLTFGLMTAFGYCSKRVLKIDSCSWKSRSKDLHPHVS